jgi:hypothetical protein
VIAERRDVVAERQHRSVIERVRAETEVHWRPHLVVAGADGEHRLARRLRCRALALEQHGAPEQAALQRPASRAGCGRIVVELGLERERARVLIGRVEQHESLLGLLLALARAAEIAGQKCESERAGPEPGKSFRRNQGNPHSAAMRRRHCRHFCGNVHPPSRVQATCAAWLARFVLLLTGVTGCDHATKQLAADRLAPRQTRGARLRGARAALRRKHRHRLQLLSGIVGPDLRWLLLSLISRWWQSA